MGSATLSQEELFPLTQCTPADIPEMHKIWQSAFSKNPVHYLMFPKTIDPDEELAWYLKRASGQISRPEIKVLKITDVKTGKLVAFARWQFPHVKKPEEKKEEEKTEEEKKEEQKSEWPRGTNVALCDEKFGGLDRWRETYVDPESTYVALLVVTSPDYQRKGLASRLLRNVLDIADAEGKKAYIEASADGYPVYSKLGFKDVDFADIDLEKYGGEGTMRSVAMVREPVVGV